jgi:hypothetical protein
MMKNAKRNLTPNRSKCLIEVNLGKWRHQTLYKSGRKQNMFARSVVGWSSYRAYQYSTAALSRSSCCEAAVFQAVVHLLVAFMV